MKYLTAFTLLLGLGLSPAYAECPVNYQGSLTAIGSSGEFSPYYFNSLSHGRFSQGYTFQAEAKAWKALDKDKRFSYGFGADIIGGGTSAVDYERYNASDKTWFRHAEKPSSVWLQQLYGEIKYRSVFAYAGIKEEESALLNQRLTSGDLIESGNTRPIPQIRAGFIDFQDIPFTNGWVQIQGEVAYGKLMDDGWWKDHYNYYNYHITDGCLYNYKRCYFRTKPSKPLSLTIGMQAAAFFGGTTHTYFNGTPSTVFKHKSNVSTFLKMLLPYEDGGDEFYTGSHLGAWDIQLRYRLKTGHEIKAYTSWLWEDGSGIGKLNGWDGLWGLEYKAPSKGWLNGAVVEYLDFTNQSGPIHFAPGDFSGTTITDHASGGDDYYNNIMYNSYAYFGHSIGTPAIMAPIYNVSGYIGYRTNAMRGFHIGLEGNITPEIEYLVKGGYRKSWGNGSFILPHPIHLSSVMLEATWHPRKISGLSVNGKLEIDRGNMPCNSFGAMLSVRYEGLLKL